MPGTAGRALERHVNGYGFGDEEPAYYYVNFLSLFGRSVPHGIIKARAEQAAKGRGDSIRAFDERLTRMGVAFDEEYRRTGRKPTAMPSVVLNGWCSVDIPGLQARYPRGFLVALFHFGAHREILLDLASMGVPFVAPVAKQAYFACAELTARGPVAFDEAIQLLAVEDPRVGRKLLTSLRSNRVGLIYVDGNMGPDGDRLEDGAVEVDFFGRRIRVKAGVARLSHALNRPVVPLIVRQGVDAVDAPAVEALGVLMPPSDDRGRVSMMQAIYDGLADAVCKDPARWEFGFCLHRWLIDVSQAPASSAIEVGASLTVPRTLVALFFREGLDYWVHVGRQKAYIFPQWAQGLYEWLEGQVTTSRAIAAWLVRQGATDVEADKFIVELVERELLVCGLTAWETATK